MDGARLRSGATCKGPSIEKVGWQQRNLDAVVARHHPADVISDHHALPIISRIAPYETNFVESVGRKETNRSCLNADLYWYGWGIA